MIFRAGMGLGPPGAERYGWTQLVGDCSGGVIAALSALPYGLAMASLMRLPSWAYSRRFSPLREREHIPQRPTQAEQQRWHSWFWTLRLLAAHTAIRTIDWFARCIYQIYTGIVAERKDPLDACTGFDWDEGNAPKNWERHQVTPEESEDVFFNEPLVVRSDVRHSKQERRHYALGQTSGGRYLFVAFTSRRSLLCVISVRDMNRRERDAYAKHDEESGT